MSLDLETLRARMPESLRSRVPARGGLEAWLDALGPELAGGLLELEPAQILLALDELVQSGADVIPLLHRMEEQASTKQLRKVVRRGFHRLRSRGLDVGLSTREPRHSVLRPIESEAEIAVLTPLDATGRRMLFLVTPIRGGSRICSILLSDHEGILKLDHVTMRRRDARSFLRRLRDPSKLHAILIEGEAGRALVRRAQEAGENANGSPVGEIPAGLLAELTAGAGAATPGERVRLELEGVGGELTDHGAWKTLFALMERGELPAWRLEGPAVAEAARKLEALEESQLILSALQKRERSQALLAEAAESVLDGPTRERLACRLEEMAVFLRDRTDPETAAAAIRVAGQIRTARAPLDVAYLGVLLEVSCDAARRKLSQEPGHLILPG